MTFSAGSVLTAAQLNTHLRDNLLETAPAKATSSSGIIVTTAANAVVQRTPTSATVATSETTSTTTFTDLATAGPTVSSLTTGAVALVFTNASMSHDTVGRTVRADFAVSGATTRASADTTALIHEAGTANQGFRASVINKVNLTAGSNTFKMQYRVTIGGVGTFNDRHLVVVPL